MTRPTRFRFLIPALAAAPLLAAAAACGGKGDGGDTIALPAANIDTSARTTTDSTGASVTVGAPGAGTADNASGKATGVDTPITRKLRAEEAARRAQDSAAAAKKTP